MTTPHRPRRFVAALLLAASLLGLVAAVPSAEARTVDAASSTSTRATTARAMTQSQRVVVGQVNRSRTSRNRHAIGTNRTMNTRAQAWAQHLRTCQCLQHRRAPYQLAPGWCAAAENVGRSGNGGTLTAVHNAFMRSTGHRANILNPRWTDLGVGVARDGAGEYFVVHVFADYRC